MADFLATYGIDDKALAIGLRRIEGLAAQHTSRMNAVSEKSGVQMIETTGASIGKGLLAAAKIGSVAAVAMFGARMAVQTATRGTEEYAKANEHVGRSFREIDYKGVAAYQRIGREISSLVLQLKTVQTEAVSGAAELVGNFNRIVMGRLSGTSADMFRFADGVKVAAENAKILEQAEAARAAIDAERLSKDPYANGKSAAAAMHAEATEKEMLVRYEGLLWQLRNRGLEEEAGRLERSIKLGAEQIVLDEKRRQALEEMDNKNRTRADLDALNEKYDSARRSTLDLVESNAMRVFALEAGEKQVQIAETQLRYEQQLRDIAKDKALLEEDRLRASSLIAEQRDAELAILSAQTRGRFNARSIALGSSVDSRQAFAPAINEERADRKAAQQKYDRMIAELRKIRDNTGQSQVATYQ